VGEVAEDEDDGTESPTLFESDSSKFGFGSLGAVWGMAFLCEVSMAASSSSNSKLRVSGRFKVAI
jgi:hypothetical protein